MGRLSQIIYYLNAESHPTKTEQAHFYTHVEITDSLKKVRRVHQNRLRKCEVNDPNNS